MANEFVHATVGASMTQAEFEAVGLHVCNSQATGDLIYASSASQLTRLAIGATSAFLQVVGGIPAWVTNIITADAATIEIGAAGTIQSGATNGDTLLIKANDTTFITLTTNATDTCTIASATLTTPVLASFYQAGGGGLISVPASVGADTVCLIGATQELDGKTLDSSVAKGTWTASGTWTIPAVTLGGNVSAAGAIVLQPSGDSDDYFSFTTASNIPTITATGADGLALGNSVLQVAVDVSDYFWLGLGGTSGAALALGIEDQVVVNTDPRRMRLVARTATAVLTGRNTEFIFDNQYWTAGAANASFGLFLYHQILTNTPTSKLTFEFGAVGDSPTVKQALWSNGDFTVLGKLGIGFLTTPAQPLHVHIAADQNLLCQDKVIAADGVCLQSINDALNANKTLELRASSVLISGGSLNLDTGLVYKVANVQVVGARQVDARINDIPNSGDGTTDGIIAALQACVQTHGLMTAA